MLKRKKREVHKIPDGICFIRVRNIVSYFKGRISIEGIWTQSKATLCLLWNKFELTGDAVRKHWK
jgi:hypothetical protein